MSLSAEAFLGEWRIERYIRDVRAGQDAFFAGRALISEQRDGWLYAEAGQLVIQGGAPMTAERRYLWRADETGVDVSFEDGRFFHRITLASAANAAHWCDPDQYDVRYDFSEWPVWKSVWSVTGPKKNYTMETTYRP